MRVSRRNGRTERPQRAKPVHRDGPARRGTSFRCLGCGLDVPMWAPGTAHRNHCPTCLCSRHVDRTVPGDRASSCGGRMDPISISVRGGGEWLIVHRCGACGAMGVNRTAGDDNPLALVRIAVRPLSHLDRVR
ncbi:RNHCP domain protein [Prescottella equi]|nr:RNHCP domain-containing protein [Prescottella equi]MBM4525717.1 RNHCP domain-containing protein [Prescottella equi]MBM4651516.1 RNHCP domain-containing protein [Prescottella equi]MBM4696636.1 RNHCP domain-containing protein [Prescottella equi]NKR27943.1 RNHCP domain-containing protein [Prescottella equi]